MFRLSVNIGGAFDLYVSGNASADLRNFSPAAELQEGEVDRVHLTLLRYDVAADYGRARYLILLTEARVAGEVRSRVREYLEGQLESEFDHLVSARSRGSVANDRERVANVCEAMYNLWQAGAFNDAESYSNLTKAAGSRAHGPDSEEKMGRGGEEGAREETFRKGTRAKSSHVVALPELKKEESDFDGEQKAAGSWVGAASGSTPWKGASARGRRATRTWPIVALAVLLGLVSAGMFVIYLGMTGLGETVEKFESKVDKLLEGPAAGVDVDSVNDLANQMRFVSDTLRLWETPGEGNPVVRMYKDLIGHVETVKGEFTFGEAGPKPGSLLDAIDRLSASGFGVLDKAVLKELSSELVTLRKEVVALKDEVKHLADEEATGSGGKAIAALREDVGNLRQRIDGMADVSEKTSLAYVVRGLRQEIEEIKGLAPFLSYREECMVVQLALKQLGYYTDDVDGLCSSRTRDSLIKYQRIREFEASGVLTEEQLRQLLNEVKEGS